MSDAASLPITLREHTEPARAWSSWRYRVFVAAWVIYAAYYFCRKPLSVVIPMMTRTLRDGRFDLAHLVFVFSLAYAIGQVLAGTLADRVGPRAVATCGGLISAAC